MPKQKGILENDGKLLTLHLTLHKQAFDVMISGEKIEEYRKASTFILSRLYNKQGFVNNFSFVKFVNGYGNHRPAFICEYLGFEVATIYQYFTYTNGLKVTVEPGDIIIKLGKILETKNITK